MFGEKNAGNYKKINITSTNSSFSQSVSLTADSNPTTLLSEIRKVKLKPTAIKYYSCYNGSFNVFVTPAKYFDMEWEYIGKVPYVSYYNVKLRSNGIIILVSEEDIIEM